ncbi:hypothetical protein PAMA_017621 [Pampus argenteus]
MKTRVSENTWECTGSITQRHGAAEREEGLPEAPRLLLLLLPVVELRRVQTLSIKSKFRRRHTSTETQTVFRQHAGSELPGSRVFRGGAGRETLQEDESLNEMKTAGSTPRRPEDTSCDPERQAVRSAAEDRDPHGEEENKPKESDCCPDREVRVELQGSELWKRFYEIGTEMIITKAGRRMFPSVRVKVRNLEPCQQYYIAMDVMPVDSKRYRYVYHSSQWMVAGNTDHSCISPRLYVHPDSPCAGETWMRQVVSFDRVKLTNNEMDDKGHIILQSMHKYRPRVHVIRHDPRMDLSQIQSLPAEGVHSFSFPETEFTTVTAYQNQQKYSKKQMSTRCRRRSGCYGDPVDGSGLFDLTELRIANRQRLPSEEPPTSLLLIPSPSLRLSALLPGCRSPHPGSSSLREDLRLFPSAQQSLHLPGSRQTERPAAAVSANRPPALLCTAGEETSPLQGSMSSRVSGKLLLPDPPPQPPQPSGVCVFSPSSLRHGQPLLSLPLQLPPEPPTRSYFPARQTSRRHHRLSAAPVSVAPDHQPLPLTAGPHLQAPAH